MTRPAAVRPSVAVPEDARLPQVAALLDAEQMASALGRALGRREPLPPPAIRYVRYRPGKNLCVHYVADVDGEEQHVVSMASSKHDLAAVAADPAYREPLALVAPRTPAPQPLLYDPTLSALIQWLPFDLDMPVLAEPAAALATRLRALGVEIDLERAELTLLQYRPRRRAALGFGDHVLKVYRYERDYRDGVAGLELAGRLGGLRTARGEAVLDDCRLTVQERLPGTPPSRRAELAREAGEVLRALHGHLSAGLQPLLPAERLSAAATAVDLVSVLAPRLEVRARALLAELERRAPDVGADLVTSHGDFHGGQLLELQGGPALIDLDLVGAGPAALDLASYAGHMVPKEAPDSSAALAALEALVEGYGSRPPWLDWYLSVSILRRARVPFRNFEADWHEQMGLMVTAAEAALQR